MYYCSIPKILSLYLEKANIHNIILMSWINGSFVAIRLHINQRTFFFKSSYIPKSKLPSQKRIQVSSSFAFKDRIVISPVGLFVAFKLKNMIPFGFANAIILLSISTMLTSLISKSSPLLFFSSPKARI